MPYETPSASDLTTRHPAFSSLDSDYIDAVIAEAERFVDSTWFEDDYQPAVMHLAAHMLIAEGALEGSVKGVLTSESIGDASASYDNSDKADASDYRTTSYGRAYMRLLRVNKGGVATTDEAG